MAGARTTSSRFSPFGEDGKLTPDAIEALVRRVWWGDYDCRWEPDGTRIKSVPLMIWWPAHRWPAWWPVGAWVECGDGLEARTLRLAGASGALEVRRTRAG